MVVLGVGWIRGKTEGSVPHAALKGRPPRVSTRARVSCLPLTRAAPSDL